MTVWCRTEIPHNLPFNQICIPAFVAESSYLLSCNYPQSVYLTQLLPEMVIFSACYREIHMKKRDGFLFWSTYIFSCIKREGDAIQEADGVSGNHPVQGLGTSVIGMQEVLVALWGSLQMQGVSFPEHLLQPHCVDRAGGHRRPAATTGQRKTIGKLGDGQDVLAGQYWLQSGQWIRGFICELLIVQTCKR